MATPETSGGTKCMSAETLTEHAEILLAACGVDWSDSKIKRTVRQFKDRVERNGFPFEAFLLNSVKLTAEQKRLALLNPDIARVISYADPTGECAVNNVMRHTAA
jgi:hypothetical protein